MKRSFGSSVEKRAMLEKELPYLSWTKQARTKLFDFKKQSARREQDPSMGMEESLLPYDCFLASAVKETLLVSDSAHLCWARLG
jgi:hypothetical protein